MQILVLAFIFVAVLAATPTEVRADDDDERLRVEIEYANYLDHDSDDLADDVLTVFTVEPPKGDDDDDDDDDRRWDGTTEITCWLELPSGTKYSINFETKIGEGIRVTVVWINCAVEEGWYKFTVVADGIGRSAPDTGWDRCVFDPPKGSPAPPVIEIYSIVEL